MMNGYRLNEAHVSILHSDAVLMKFNLLLVNMD
jgi:hypothetical protein